jgi:hypothetical protein
MQFEEMAPMQEFLSRFGNDELIGLVAVVGAFLCGIPAVVGGIWYAIRNAEITGALKQDMLNRGMSAEEIQIVLDAGTGRSGKVMRNRLASKV